MRRACGVRILSLRLGSFNNHPPAACYHSDRSQRHARLKLLSDEIRKQHSLINWLDDVSPYDRPSYIQLFKLNKSQSIKSDQLLAKNTDLIEYYLSRDAASTSVKERAVVFRLFSTLYPSYHHFDNRALTELMSRMENQTYESLLEHDLTDWINVNQALGFYRCHTNSNYELHVRSSSIVYKQILNGLGEWNERVRDDETKLLDQINSDLMSYVPSSPAANSINGSFELVFLNQEGVSYLYQLFIRERFEQLFNTTEPPKRHEIISLGWVLSSYLKRKDSLSMSQTERDQYIQLFDKYSEHLADNIHLIGKNHLKTSLLSNYCRRRRDTQQHTSNHTTDPKIESLLESIHQKLTECGAKETWNTRELSFHLSSFELIFKVKIFNSLPARFSLLHEPTYSNHITAIKPLHKSLLTTSSESDVVLGSMSLTQFKGPVNNILFQLEDQDLLDRLFVLSRLESKFSLFSFKISLDRLLVNTWYESYICDEAVKPFLILFERLTTFPWCPSRRATNSTVLLSQLCDKLLKTSPIDLDNHNRIFLASMLMANRVMATELYETQIHGYLIKLLESPLTKIDSLGFIFKSIWSNVKFYSNTYPTQTQELIQRVYEFLIRRLVQKRAAESYVFQYQNIRGHHGFLLRFRHKLNIKFDSRVAGSLQEMRSELNDYLKSFDLVANSIESKTDDNQDSSRLRSELKNFEYTMYRYGLKLKQVVKMILLSDVYNFDVVREITRLCITVSSVLSDTLFADKLTHNSYHELFNLNVKNNFNLTFILDLITVFGLFDQFNYQLLADSDPEFKNDLEKLRQINHKLYERCLRSNEHIASTGGWSSLLDVSVLFTYLNSRLNLDFDSDTVIKDLAILSKIVVSDRLDTHMPQDMIFTIKEQYKLLLKVVHLANQRVCSMSDHEWLFNQYVPIVESDINREDAIMFVSSILGRDFVRSSSSLYKFNFRPDFEILVDSRGLLANSTDNSQSITRIPVLLLSDSQYYDNINELKKPVEVYTKSFARLYPLVTLNRDRILETTSKKELRSYIKRALEPQLARHGLKFNI